METIHTGAATTPPIDRRWNSVKDLYDAAGAIECSKIELEELLDAFQLLGEQMEDEGLQLKEPFEDWRAVCFSRRFPLHCSAFRVLTRDLYRITQELGSACAQAFVAWKQGAERSVSK